MTTDYLLFVHGVNVRPMKAHAESANYADPLIQQITKLNQASGSPLRLEASELQWYSLMQQAEAELKALFARSPNWPKFWFRDFRETRIIPFMGDAALYISRYIGSEVARLLLTQSIRFLENRQAGDRLHLITHSWGTVILFDLLFAGRWDDPKIPGYNDVKTIRSALFGIEPNLDDGIPIASIHTMGSPIALANLINLKREEMAPKTLTVQETHSVFTHDITLGLEQFLEALYQQRQRPLAWKNYAHPGDPIAYPLATVIPTLLSPLGAKADYLNIQDLLTSGGGPVEWVSNPFKSTFLALANGGNAHSSYWQSKQVAQTILATVQESEGVAE
ncbi:MAG: hypothetical protein Fur0046_31580 [Cyanobacteria bacterium J069]|nr:MAG: hypothetical protein D6742_05920 [Cyanobacteria bacterium J069]